MVRDKLPRRRHRSARVSSRRRWKAPTFARTDNRYLLLYNRLSLLASSRQEEKKTGTDARNYPSRGHKARPQNHETSAGVNRSCGEATRFYGDPLAKGVPPGIRVTSSAQFLVPPSVRSVQCLGKHRLRNTNQKDRFLALTSPLTWFLWWQNNHCKVGKFVTYLSGLVWVL